jgi:choline kinase
VIPPAVVLAAGNGARLNAGKAAEPKPLVAIAGLSLIDHVVGRLTAAGVERVFVVTGHAAQALRAHRFLEPPSAGITFVHNPRYEEPNGLSLLAVEPLLAAPFLLLMADHLFAPGAIEDVARRRCPQGGGLLAIDRSPGTVFDLDDATRVSTRGDTLVAIGKRLAVYDAVDTGLFLLAPAAFSAMRRSIGAGDASLSGGIGVLAQGSAMKVVEVHGPWIDVDTPGAVREAERLVRSGKVGCPAAHSARG